MDLKKELLRFSYSLEASKRYKSIKSKVDEILNNQSSSLKSYFDYFMIFLVISTILILILEVKHKLPAVVYVFEAFAVFIFIIEWLLRLWVSSDFHISVIESFERAELEHKKSTFWSIVKPALIKKFKFIVSPMSIIDLLAILPSYRPLRIFRFFLLFRLFKVFRYTQNANFFLKVFKEKRFEFITLIVIFSFMTFFAATVIYIFEGGGENDKIDTFLDAIYWAVITITTVGYGDVTPQTHEGRIVTLFLIIGGVAIISFMTSIITTSMTEKLQEVKAQHILNEVAKLKEFVLVCGYGKMGKVLADELYRAGKDFVIIDNDPLEIESASKRGYLALEGDASDIDILKDLKVDKKVSVAVALTNDDTQNLSILLSIRSISNVCKLFSRLNDIKSYDKLKIAGANEEVFPYHVAARAAYKYFRQPVAFSAVDNILLERYDPIVDEIELIEGSKAINHKIKSIGIKKHDLKVLGVIRCSEDAKLYFNPDVESFILKERDVLIVIGDSENIANFKIDLFKG